MTGVRVAQRYAKGLMKFAKETNQTDLIYSEMNTISKLIAESQELRIFLNSPIIEEKKKEAALKEIFQSFSNATQLFISLIVRQKRENILSKIANQFISIYDKDNHIATIEITSVTQLDENTIENIVAKAKQNLAKTNKVEVINKIDESLIGGFILKVDNKQIDTSIKTKLATLKKDFSK